MNDAGPARTRPEDPRDDELGHLIGEGLRRHTGGLVDEHRLLAAATRGAARTRRRRAVAVRVAAALVVVLPAGAAAVQITRRDTVATTSTASRQEQADAGSASTDAQVSATGGPGDRGQGSGAEGAKDGPASLLSSTPSVPSLTAGSATSSSSDQGTPGRPPDRERFAAGLLPVPDDVMLTAADLRDGPAGAVTGRVSDTANRSVVPVPDPGATCGTPASAAASAEGSRQVVLARSGGGAAPWQASHTVRVFRDDGAAEYVRAIGALGCLTPLTVPGADAALAGQFRDGTGRRHWFGVVREDRTVAEIQVTGSGTDAPPPAEAERLLAAAAARMPASFPGGIASAGPS
ncbi:MAG: hypothetical protein QG622_417 [Actinomycetota bacterium]|nr:hypothetical protein [Actinomycetota bacterium]